MIIMCGKARIVGYIKYCLGQLLSKGEKSITTADKLFIDECFLFEYIDGPNFFFNY